MRSALCLLLLTGCPDYNLDSIDDPSTIPAQSLHLDPELLDFGAQPLGSSTTATVTLSNLGDAPLSLSYLGLDEGSAFTAVLPEQSALIQPGKSLSVAVAFSPYNSTDLDRLRIISDDPLRPESWVELRGAGAFPELQITPNPLILATAAAGLSARGEFSLTNTGAAPLEIRDVLLTGSHFALEGAGVPAVLQPGESTWAEISFFAPGVGLYDGQLWTEDSTLAGNNSAGILGASAVPVAQCGVTPETVAPLQESADWLGSASFDASGLPLSEHRWTLVRQPAGSVATLPPGGADREGFIADLAGEYVAELVVINTEGEQSAPCLAVLRAVPDQNLWIELFWSEPDDDMDLHLLRPGGSLRTDDDCYYDNCMGGRLDWGVLGDESDDPSLDIDDIYGTGPENINIGQPESGTFTVLVHDYQGSTSDHYGDNEVTVSIFLGGQLAWTESRIIDGDDTFTEFAEISWPEGAVTSLP
ncbi:MAG: hypothetical protein ACI8S6_005297 [Myxococcota bacterium]|jgi:hypothetical protein